jgi:hypothetical protein
VPCQRAIALDRSWRSFARAGSPRIRSGAKFRGGYHDLLLDTGGLTVFPSLVAAEHHKVFLPTPASTGSSRIASRLRCSLRLKLGDGGGPQANGCVLCGNLNSSRARVAQRQ